MKLDPEICYRALTSRDARFDGRFFTGVVSTGVYCRPVCPAQTPKPENCRYYACAAAATEAGFRPCLRCRPEASPGTPAWQGTSATVSRAMRLIDSGILDADGVDQLADRLGVGARHLRRLFKDHLGAPPLAVGQTRRLLFAKKLIDETSLPMTEIAFSAGFQSIRRFNASIRRTYGRAPRDLRRKRDGHIPSDTSGEDLRLKLTGRPPYDWQAILDFLRPRATPGVEAVDQDSYRRTLGRGKTQGVIEVRMMDAAMARRKSSAARVVLELRMSQALVRALVDIVERVRSLFDLRADPAAIAAHLRKDSLLAPRVKARPGLRAPGAWDRFELAVRAVLGQQVTVRGATTLAGRLAHIFGELSTVDTVGELSRIFPRPAVLRTADVATIGLPRARAETIRCLAEAVYREPLILDAGRRPEECIARLRELPGIGDWTAQYIAMRALHEPDAFPAGDLGLRRSLAHGEQPASAAALNRRVEVRFLPAKSA